ncbi:hypothetical protein H0H92_015277, partial [Tricholoma furcatifolium]
MRLLEVFLLLPLCTHGRQIINHATDTFIDQVLSEWGVPGGVAVAVVSLSGEGSWNVETKGYGIATASGSQVTENTLFSIGSNSKLFTAIAVGLLMGNESINPPLSWDSKIASVLPNWGLEDAFATNQSSIFDLLGHRTGLPRHDLSYKWSDSTPMLIQKLHYQRLSSEFRAIFQYNNNMYTLLSYLPTVLLPSKIPFARYVKEQIIDPLGLTSTTYAYDVAKSGQLADGFSRQNINYSSNPFLGTPKKFPFWTTFGGVNASSEDGNKVAVTVSYTLSRVLSAAGGVISNAVDMAKWLQMLLENGLKPGTNATIIDPDIIDTVSSGITVLDTSAPFPEVSVSVYGGGQIQSTYRGHVVVEHDGSVTGFTSLITRLPADNIGIAVLTNDQDYGSWWMRSIRYRLIDEALGLQYVDWDSRFKEIALAVIPPLATPRAANATLPSLPFASLAGRYDNMGYGKPDTDNTSEPYWTYSLSGDFDSGTSAVFDVDKGQIGFGLSGIWGAGVGTPSPQRNAPRARAEVWFEKIQIPKTISPKSVRSGNSNHIDADRGVEKTKSLLRFSSALGQLWISRWISLSAVVLGSQ